MRSLLFLVAFCAGCGSQSSAPTKLGLGGSCTLAGASGCVSGFCAQLDTGAALCSLSCGSTTSCPSGWACRDDRSPAVCVPAASSRSCSTDSDCPAAHRCTSQSECVIPAARARCVACADSMQCAVGLVCASAGDGLSDVCLEPCEQGTCGAGASCLNGACVPVGTCSLVADLCSSCRRDSECGGRNDYCVRNLQLGRSFCARDCSDQPCPGGFRCQSFEFGDQCVPEDGQCQGRCLVDYDCPNGFSCLDGRCSHQEEHRGLCAPCTEAGDCDQGICVQGRDGRTVCAPSCGVDEQCPNGSVCSTVRGTQEQACLPRTGKCPVGVGASGRRCSAPEDCASGLCLRPDGERSGRCVDACSGGVCSEGKQCTVIGGAEVCLDRRGEDGAPCSAGATCNGGLCVSLATESICSRSCESDSSCAQGWSCKSVSGDRMACLPLTDGGAIGAMCHSGASSCESALCLILRTGPVCTTRCEQSGDCPQDWGCLTVDGRGMPEGGERVCVPQEEN